MAESETQQSEIYMENLALKENIDALRRSKERRLRHPSIALMETVEGSDTINLEEYKTFIHDQGNTAPSKEVCIKKVKHTVLKCVVLTLLAVILVIGYLLNESKQESDLRALLAPTSSLLKQPPMTSPNVENVLQNAMQKHYFNIGMRQDYLLQECQGSTLKQSFPDIDYALLGYNILQGYPLAVGHDPGFTYPIFVADYSSGGQTADCRYSVPKGLVIIPDVSCVTSFSSTTVQTKYEFSKALSVSASVSGGGWGVSFSASAGYKESSSEISTGEHVYILSTASCNYYFSKLITNGAPRFNDDFMEWVYKLNETDSRHVDFEQTYNDFFDTYGTHFPTEVTFGARYTYEYKMSSQKYESQQEKGVDVSVQASYSGLFSVGGGFNMASSQKQSASEFSSSVETKTITVGAAPPSNGDAMTWASQVKTSPVPTAYKLSSIDLLFTGKYMEHFDIDHDRIKKDIEKQKFKYCTYLKDLGKLESCDDLTPGLLLEKTRLVSHYRQIAVSSVTECVEKCLQEIQCVGITYCKTCSKSFWSYKICFLFKEIGHQKYGYKTEEPDTVWQSTIFPEKIKTQVQFRETSIIGVKRGFENENDQMSNLTKCQQLCMQDAYCVAYSHCECPASTVKCMMYSKNQVKALKKDPTVHSYFISSRYYTHTTTTTSTKSSTTTTSRPSKTQEKNF